MSTRVIGRKILRFDRVTSTNDIARSLALQGEQEGAVIVATEQSHGKGKGDRKWFSPRGGLWLSIILRPKMDIADMPRLSLIAGSAAVEAINKRFQIDVAMKWPNDIMVNDRKCGGALCVLDKSSRGDSIAIIGVGINCNVAKNDFPDEIKESATSLRLETRRGDVSIEALLECYLTVFEKMYLEFETKGFARLRDSIIEKCVTLGNKVELSLPTRRFRGRAIDINEAGELVIELEGRPGERRSFSSGDVRCLKA